MCDGSQLLKCKKAAKAAVAIRMKRSSAATIQPLNPNRLAVFRITTATTGTQTADSMRTMPNKLRNSLVLYVQCGRYTQCYHVGIPVAMQLQSALCGSTLTGETNRRSKAEENVDLRTGGH